MDREWMSSSREETYRIAREVARCIEDGMLPPWVFLIGDIGSGKTTFVRGMLSLWGLEESVSSPTFSLIHRYEHPIHTIYHVDLYRLRSLEEVEEIGFYDLFQKDHIVLVEWPEMVENVFEPVHTRIHLWYGEEENRRRISLTTTA